MTEYEESKEFTRAIEKMLSDKKFPEFNAIREHETMIYGLMCVRTDNEGNDVEPKGDPITCRKIPPPFFTMTGGHYLVLCDSYFWNHKDEIQKEARLYHALKHIKIVVPEKGPPKFVIEQPPVKAWPSEVANFGAHSTDLLDFREAMKHGSNRFAENMKAPA